MLKKAGICVLCATLALLPASASAGREQADTLNIRFRLDSTRIDMNYAGNRQAWDTFERRFHEMYSGASPSSLRLDIYSGASPEGTAAHNRWLGETRGLSIRRLVRQRLGQGISSIVVHNEAARWDGLYQSVASSREPWRDEVLHIIELEPSSDENQWDHRERKLRALRGGTVWPVLLDRYLAPLRSGATAVLSWVSGRDTIFVRDTVVMAVPVYPCDLAVGAAPAADDESDGVRKPVRRMPVWILRTNLPLLGTGTPNLQAEWSLGHRDRWSLNVEGVWSWWTFSYNKYANEILYGSVELRYWLGRRYRHHTLDGWHIGLAAGGGYGDLEWQSRGFQGEVYSGFVNVGWQRRFGRRKQWAFDAGIGLGYAHIPWRRYTGSRIFPHGHEERHDDHLMWRETGRTNWVGATHANISLGYVFSQHDAAWRRAAALERAADRNAYLHYRDSVKARERFERDSIVTADRQRERELRLLPRAERSEARASLKAERRETARAAKAEARQARADARVFRQEQKAEARQRRQEEAARKAAYRDAERERKAWLRTPEGKAERKETLRAEKEAARLARADAKAARRQAKADARQQRRAAKLSARAAADRRRDLERLQRGIEKADQKYRTVE